MFMATSKEGIPIVAESVTIRAFYWDSRKGFIRLGGCALFVLIVANLENFFAVLIS